MKGVIRAALCLCLWSPLLEAQNVQLTFGSIAGRVGDTLLVSVSASTIPLSDSIYSGQVNLIYNTSVYRAISVDTTGTLLGGFGTILFNPTTNTFVFAGTNILTGTGVLFKIRVIAVGGRGTVTSLTATASFNEGKPTVSEVAGSMRIFALLIFPNAPPGNLYVGDLLHFSATGDIHHPLVWSVADTNVGKIDTAGVFHALTAGQDKVFLMDSIGLKDSTVLFGIYPFQGKNLTLYVDDTSHTQTLTFNLPIYTTNLTGLGVLSAQFTLTYNSSALQSLDVIPAGSMTSGWSAPSFNVTSGRVDVALAGTSVLNGAGVLVYIKLKVLNTASGVTGMSLSNVLFNENLNANTLGGSFSAITAPVINVVPNGTICTAGDTVRFNVGSGGTPPYTWSSTAASIATIDNSGLLHALGRGTTVVQATDFYGFVGSSATITVNDCFVGLPDTMMGKTDSIEVPILVRNVNAVGIYSFECRIVYDSTVVHATAVLSPGTLSNGYTISYRDTLDTLRIAAAGSAALTSSGILFRVRLKCVTPTVGDSARLVFSSFKFNEGFPTVTQQNGLVKIGSNSVLPVELLAFSASAIREGVVLQWRTATETNNFGFEIERKTVERFQLSGNQSSAEWSIIGMLNGYGVSSGPHDYSFTDRSLPAGRYEYKLVQIMSDGSKRVSQSIQVETGIAPRELTLNQNYPNPFNPTTTIEFSVPDDGRASLTVFDMLGRPVSTLVEGDFRAGHVQQVVFDASRLASGTYWVRLQFKDSHQAMKMLLMK
jgi:hypothetical protein